MKAKEAALQIINDRVWRHAGSTDVDADSLFPIQIAEVLSMKRPRINYAAVNFAEHFERNAYKSQVRWYSEPVAVASNSAHPLALRMAALRGFDDPGEDGWENEELNAVAAI